tara:strand:- start:3815 stop:4498 length:684 start_codon:yes stop_codon:yes gene_type:complete
MNLINKLSYSNNIEYYLFYFLLIIIVVHKFYKIITLKDFLSIIISLVCVYLIFIYNLQNTKNSYECYQNKTKLFEINGFTYLQNDSKLANIYIDLIGLKYINTSAFNESMRNINLFLKNYIYLKKELENSKHSYYYENALRRRNMAINNLLSLIVNSSKYEKDIIPIKNSIIDIKRITLDYLYHMENIINYSWIHSETNINSKPIESYGALPNSNSDILYDKFLNIY